jgi:CheY-like chemotaxis protein
VALITSLLAKTPEDRPRGMQPVWWELQAIRSELQTPPREEPYSVLIVDDDPQSIRLLSLWTSKAAPDAEIRSAGEGIVALEMVRRRPPHLMLVDLHMPGMSGLELCMYMRGTHLADRCTIVSVSASAGDHDVQLLRELGITQFVRKGPDLPAQLMDVVRSVRELV